MFNRKDQNPVPDSVSFEKLQQALMKRDGYSSGSIFSREYTAGTGCQCSACVIERRELIHALSPKISEDRKRQIEQDCPQRAAREMPEPKIITPDVQSSRPDLIIGWDLGGSPADTPLVPDPMAKAFIDAYLRIRKPPPADA